MVLLYYFIVLVLFHHVCLNSSSFYFYNVGILILYECFNLFIFLYGVPELNVFGFYAFIFCSVEVWAFCKYFFIIAHIMKLIVHFLHELFSHLCMDCLL